MEKSAFKLNGFVLLLLALALFGVMVVGIIYGWIVFAVIAGVIGAVICCGFVIVFPNKVAVLTFFGRYTGCIRENGFWFVVPFTISKRVSVRVVNFNSERLKVNDISGNPIEIATVVVYRVADAAKAIFDVDNYLEFVEIQSETALRHVAAKYPYDNFSEEGHSLRGDADFIAQELQDELAQRMRVAGLEIIEARLTHLAYATEIANAMLQRQQAAAILAARQIIVEGAVGMAQMAIRRLEEEDVVQLDDGKKVAMINNLMVAIVSDRAAQPVINTGSLN